MGEEKVKARRWILGHPRFPVPCISKPSRRPSKSVAVPRQEVPRLLALLLRLLAVAHLYFWCLVFLPRIRLS